MHLHGIVRTATLEENPPGSDTIEMILSVQGVGPGQPRRIVLPYEMLLEDPTLEPEAIAGHAFQAEVIEADPRRWLATAIQFAGKRVLRIPEE